MTPEMAIKREFPPFSSVGLGGVVRIFPSILREDILDIFLADIETVDLSVGFDDRLLFAQGHRCSEAMLACAFCTYRSNPNSA